MNPPFAERRDEPRAASTRVDAHPFPEPMSQRPDHFDPNRPSPNASRFSAHGPHLPTHAELTDDDREGIVRRVRSFHGVSS